MSRRPPTFDTMHFIIHYSCTHSQTAFVSILGYPRVKQAVRLTESTSVLVVTPTSKYAHNRFEDVTIPTILVLLNIRNHFGI